MHFELVRRLDEPQLEQLADARPVGARRRAPRGARLRARWPTARAAWCRSRAPAPPATPTTRSTRRSRSSSGSSATTSSSSATASTGSRRRRSASCPARGSASSPTRRRRSSPARQPIASLSPDVRERALEGDLLIVSKTNRLSTVHRRTRMDYVGVRKVSADGRIVGEARMLGLFTSKAYAEPASQTPLLNRKLRQILRHEDLIEGSHDYKAAVALFDSFPKDELFSARTDDLRRAVVALLSLEGDGVRLLGRVSSDGRSASLIAALPAARYDAELLDAFTALLRERFGTDAVDTHTVLGEGERVRVHANVHVPGGVPDVPLRELEQELIALTRTWEDGAARAARRPLRPGARARAGGAAGARASRSTTAPRSSRRWRSPTSSASTGSSARRCRSSSGLQNEPGRTRVALYKTGGKVELGEAMPTLEDARPARDRGGPDAPARRRRRHLGAGLRRARPRRPPARARRRRRARRRLHRGRAARRRRVRHAQPARRRRRPGLAPGQHPARLPHVPPADRLALHAGLPERRARGQPGADREADALLRAALRPVAAARPGGRDRAARRDRRRPRRGHARSTTTASCATSSA